MITVQQVREAVSGDRIQCDEIYGHFFESGRIDGWLVNKGVTDEAERSELLSELQFEFWKQLPKYNKQRVKFECWMWTIFNQTFLNFQKKQGKFNQRYQELNATTVKFHTGSIDGDLDLGIDIEIISRGLTGTTKVVFEAMVAGYQRKDMKELNLSEAVWDSERNRLRRTLAQYGYGK